MISTESRVKGLQRESPSPPENLNAGNWVCLGTPKHGSPKEPPVSYRYGGGSCLSTYLPIHIAFQNRMFLLLSKFRHGDTWRKVKFDTFNPEMDPIWGCLYSGDRAQAGQLNGVGAQQGGGEGRRGQMGHVKRLRTAPKYPNTSEAWAGKFSL